MKPKENESIFRGIDEPQENFTLSEEVRSQMSYAFAEAHMILDEERKSKFLFRLVNILLENTATKNKDNLSDLFLNLKDKFLNLKDKKDLVFNWDRDKLAVIKPTDLSEESIREYCKNIDFLGVMVVDDGKGNQVKVSNYDKTQQEDPGDKSFATHSVSKLIGGVIICKMIADKVIPEGALDAKLELSDEVKKKLPEEISDHLKNNNVTLRDVMTHLSGLGGYLDPELQKEQPGYGTRELGYGVNGYSGYVRQKLEKGEKVEVPNSPQDYLKYAEIITYEYKKYKYSDLGIMLASLSTEQHYNKGKDPREHKSFEEIVRDQLITQAGVEKFSAKMPSDAVFHSDDPIAPYITGTAGCGYWTNLDGLVKIGQWIFKMWQDKDETFKDTVINCGQEFYDKKEIIKHPGGIDSSETLLSVDLASGYVVVTEERRLGSHFPFPGWGVVTTARNLYKKQLNQEQPQVQAGNLNLEDKTEKPRSFLEATQAEKYGNIGSKGGDHEL